MRQLVPGYSKVIQRMETHRAYSLALPDSPLSFPTRGGRLIYDGPTAKQAYADSEGARPDLSVWLRLITVFLRVT